MKRFLKAILWILIYGGLGWIVGKHVFGFDILSADNWDIFFDKGLKVWPPRMAPKKLLCKLLLGFIIIGVLGLGIITRKKHPSKGQPVFVKPNSVGSSGFAPARMPTQGKIMAFQPNPPVSPSSTATPITNTVQPPAPQNTFQETVNKISAVVDDFDATAFPHVKLENTFTHLVVSDDSTALLLKILVTPGEWQVQQGPTIRESLWIINQQEPQKILVDILNSTETLTRLEPDASSIAVVILTNVSIQNPKETERKRCNT